MKTSRILLATALLSIPCLAAQAFESNEVSNSEIMSYLGISGVRLKISDESTPISLIFEEKINGTVIRRKSVDTAYAVESKSKEQFIQIITETPSGTLKRKVQIKTGAANHSSSRTEEFTTADNWSSQSRNDINEKNKTLFMCGENLSEITKKTKAEMNESWELMKNGVRVYIEVHTPKKTPPSA